MSLIHKHLGDIRESLDDPSLWKSLIINKRKPHTIRLYRQLSDGNRVCLHHFDKCEMDDSFDHPHAWPAEFLVLQGRYRERLYYGADTPSEGQRPLVDTIYTRGSWHELVDPMVWHNVSPIESTYTIMINGQPFDNPLPQVRTVKGKDLDDLNHIQLKDYLVRFKRLISLYEKSLC